MALKDLNNKLKSLQVQKQSIENEITQIKKQIEKLSPFSKTQKISLFKSLFIAREDVYATHWVSKDGLKKGYSPATYTFRGDDYKPIDEGVIQQHLEGKIRLGTYAVISKVMAKFLVIDLDKASFIDDARAIKKVCGELEVYPLFEISKSGNGIHVWFFFEDLVKASDVRKFGDMLITKAMDIGSGIDMSSYDRMFPNQDFVPDDALGNLVAIPLHFGSRGEGKTVFVDIAMMQIFDDQWGILRNVQKISISKLSNMIMHIVGQDSLIPWEIKKDVAIVFPANTNAILFDSLYIDKLSLSNILLNRLKRFASFTNPEFYMRQKLRKSTFNTPRIISQYDLNDRYIILPRGLVVKVKEFFKSYNASLTIEDKRSTKKIDKLHLYIKLRPEQKTAFSKMKKTDYSVLIAPPGFGKTAIASALIAQRGVNTLILIHKTTLLDQWADRLCEYFDIDIKTVGRLGKGKKKITSNIDIATLQSLRNRPELIEDYSQIIVDEAHHIPAVSFEIPLKKFRGKYVVGLSATPIRKDGMHPIIFMQCGEIAHEVKIKKQKKHELKTIKTNFETFDDNFTSILNELVEDEVRNNLIVDEIEKLQDRQILLFSERVEHLNILYGLLQGKKIKSTLLHGGLSNKMQKEALNDAGESSIILSTSSYMGEGIDLSHLDTVMFTMPISFAGRMIQYLGRVGRNDQRCLAIDFVDENVPMLKSSFSKRMKGYKQMGYVELVKKLDRLNLFDVI